MSKSCPSDSATTKCSYTFNDCHPALIITCEHHTHSERQVIDGLADGLKLDRLSYPVGAGSIIIG